ncbi:MAG: hypothetical protein IJS01_10125 [Lentisphaeria bacterium]|nr:hypothetical protein [Lentisphaeria bacterium]
MLDLTKPFLDRGDKLVCFGDSLTAQEGSYAGVLAKALPENEIVNAGVGGDKTPSALLRLEKDVFSAKPDAVLVMLGANDAAVGRDCWADEPMISPEAYRCNLVWIAHLCRLRGIKKISIATPFGFEGPSYLAHGDRITAFALAAREAADELKLPLVPLDCLFHRLRNGVPLTELAVTRDGTHPTGESQEAIARAMLEAWHLAKD